MIVITAPTGLIDRQVLGNVLKGGGEPIRAIVREPSRRAVQARGCVQMVQL